MDFFSTLIIAIGLSMDCFAVSVSQGICAKKLISRPTFRMAFLFGFFQALMPLISFSIGQTFAKQIIVVDHWLAFGILFLIGVKMIYDSLTEKKDDENCDINRFKFTTLITLAVATSIDALATGLIYVPYPQIILKAVFLFGVTSFIASLTGTTIGLRFGKKINFNGEIIGGIILIIIGLKILLQHLIA